MKYGHTIKYKKVHFFSANVLNVIQYIFIEIMNFFSSKTKNDTIDPLSSIVKLYILTFKGPGSKISFYNNRITIDHAGIFQGTMRALITKSVKTDLSILTMPILYACNTYLLNDREKYTQLFETSITALTMLKSTYEGEEITHTIDTLINTIREYINNNTSVVNAVYNTDCGMLKQAFYRSISKVWTEERLQMLFLLVNQLKTETEHKMTIVTSLEYYMQYIDEKVHDIIVGLS